MLLIGLFLGIVPPLLSGGASTDMRGAARQLAAGLRVARNQAITLQREAHVTIDLENRQFRVDGESGAKVVPLPNDDDITIKLFTAESEQIDEDTARVRFFPDGSSTGGYVAVLDERVEYRVNVDWLTGRIIIEDRDPEP